MPKTIYIPEDARHSGIDITWTPSAGRLDIGGWYDTMVGIQPGSMTLAEFFAKLGITEKDVRKALSAQHQSSLFQSERQRMENKVKRLVRRFNRDDKASIAHALMHLETNKIADDNYPGHSGWYCGNREQFVKRHKKAVALMRSLLAPNGRANRRA